MTVTDGDLSDVADVVILVSDVNQEPEVIGEIEDMTIEEDPDPRQVDIVDLDEVFSDPDGDELIFDFIAPIELNMNIDEDNLLFFVPDNDFNLPNGQQIIVTADDQRGEGLMFMMNRMPSTGLKQTGRDAGPVRRLRSIDDPFMNARSPRRDIAVEASFILTIEAIPDPPEWVNIPEEINATVTERIHITIEALDVDGDALEYSAEVPEGAEFTDNGDGTGLFEWQTTLDDEGDYTAFFEVTDGDYTLEAEVPIHLGGLRDLTVNLDRGWNMISLNINPLAEFYVEGKDRGPDVWLMIEQMRIDENNHRVFSLNDEKGDFCSPGWNYNGIDYWNLQEGYLIKLTEDFEASWSGVPIPADADVPIESGWNLIAYYPDYDLPATRGSGYYVLSPILDHVIIAKNDSGQFMAPEWGYSDMDPWTPGKGYQIKVDEDVVLNYPEPYDWLGAPIKTQTGNRLEGYWSSIPSTGSNMSLLVNGITDYQFSPNDQIAAFNPSGKLVGLGNINNGQSCGLAVWGDDISTDAIDGLVKGDKFELRLYEADSDEVYNLDIVTVRQGAGLIYETDGFAVVEMSLGSPIPEDFYLCEVYPNPFNNRCTIKFAMPYASPVDLKLYALDGRLVSNLLSNKNLSAGYHNYILSADDLSNGIYMLELRVGKERLRRKLVLVK